MIDLLNNKKENKSIAIVYYFIKIIIFFNIK